MKKWAGQMNAPNKKLAGQINAPNEKADILNSKTSLKQDDDKGNKKRALRPVVDHLGVSVFLEPIFLLSVLLEKILLVIVPSAESLVTEIGGETL